MKLISITLIALLFLVGELPAQFVASGPGSLKLKDNSSFLKQYDKSLLDCGNSKNSFTQFKKRKTVTSYFGAGYSFVIFTASDMNTAYPVLDSRSGDFLSEINLYFGFAIAKAVTLEFEPSILFTNNNRSIIIPLNPPRTKGGTTTYYYALPATLSMLAFPIMGNVRFFPFFKQSNFARLFFIGGGVGAIWIREEYDNIYSISSYYYYGEGYLVTESTSQWQPILRVMTGFTGTGGQFGFGGELRYNFVPLKQNEEPFVTRIAPNFNSVDLTLRFYFSL